MKSKNKRKKYLGTNIVKIQLELYLYKYHDRVRNLARNKRIHSRKDSPEQRIQVDSRNICYFTHKLNGGESKDSCNLIILQESKWTALHEFLTLHDFSLY